MTYWEDLPDQCPPEAAQDQALQSVYRLVFSNPPLKEHFESHAKRGEKKPPGVDDCRFSSCSLCTCIKKMRNFAGLPKVKDKGTPFIAKLDIPVGAGKSQIKGKHVDFWMYDTFDPIPLCETEEP